MSTIAAFLTTSLILNAALIVFIFSYHKEIHEQDIRLRLYDSERLREMGRKFRELVKFINTDNAGDNDTLNRSVQKLLDEGYAYRKDKSTDKMLAFVKHEEIKAE